MILWLLKLLISAGLIVLVSEVSKRQPGLGGLLASLPLTALLSLIWLYGETRDVVKVAALSSSIFWYVLPSLPMFLLLPWLLRHKVHFALALPAVCLLTIGLYVIMTRVLGHYKIML